VSRTLDGRKQRESLEIYAAAVRRLNGAVVKAGYLQATDDKIVESMDEQLGDVEKPDRLRVDSAQCVSFVSKDGC